MHLFVSFMLRAVSIFVKDRVVHKSAGLQEFDATLMDNLKPVSFAPLDNSQYVSTVPSLSGSFFKGPMQWAMWLILWEDFIPRLKLTNQPDQIIHGRKTPRGWLHWAWLQCWAHI